MQKTQPNKKYPFSTPTFFQPFTNNRIQFLGVDLEQTQESLRGGHYTYTLKGYLCLPSIPKDVIQLQFLYFSYMRYHPVAFP